MILPCFLKKENTIYLAVKHLKSIDNHHLASVTLTRALTHPLGASFNGTDAKQKALVPPLKSQKMSQVQVVE